MPELPEVEIVRRGLQSILPGQKIKKVQAFRDRTIRHPTKSKFCAQLVGHRFVDVERRGKYLIFRLDGKASLVVHLGMSGRLLIRSSEDPPLSHLRMKIDLPDRHALCFQDPRVFGRVWYIDAHTDVGAIIPSITSLGVEALSNELTKSYLQNAFQTRKQSIKGILLNQSIIAGLGNIYADEALFKARVHPLKSAALLRGSEIERLIQSIKAVLNRSIASGGSTLRNYTDSDGVNGNYQRQSWVYGRAGKPCRVCGSVIRKALVMARSTHFCLRCQRAKSSVLYQSRARL